MSDGEKEGRGAGAGGFDVRRFCERYLAMDHSALLGLRYLADAPGGHVELELPYDSSLAGEGRDGASDGAVIALLDMAGTIAVWSRLDRFRPHATIDLRVDHLTPPPPVPIRGAVHCFHMDDQLARVEGTAFAAEVPVARFIATYAFTGEG
jgi:acyl-coenzyme A thioesterase PaaI-like protein